VKTISEAFHQCFQFDKNKLPDYVVQAPSTATFKKRLFSFVNSAGAEHVLTLRCFSDVMAT